VATMFTDDPYGYIPTKNVHFVTTANPGIGWS
jgi:hypothetical protein